MKNTVFELADVHYSYLGKFPALCGVSLEIRQGEKISVIGANGTGKSSLLALLDGLIFPDTGVIRGFGENLSEKALNDAEFSKFFRGKVGLVFQNPEVQLFCPTVREDIVFGPLNLGVPGEEIRKRLDKLTETFGISGLLDRSPHQLSIGEKRKIAIASTLAVEPDVLILDEPTAGLDPLTSRHIVDIILQANIEGKTVITATHDMHIVEEVSDVVYVFGQDKKIARSGSPAEILSDDDFLRENNLVHLHSHRHKDKVHAHPHSHAD